jgi:hypothetical protein
MWIFLFFCASKFEGLLTLIVTVISLSAITIERTLVWREGIYTFPPSFLPLRKKKETLSATLFLLFWTALDLVCFLHFESFILRLFFFFFSWTQVYPLLWLLLLASTYSSVMMLY